MKKIKYIIHPTKGIPFYFRRNLLFTLFALFFGLTHYTIKAQFTEVSQQVGINHLHLSSSLLGGGATFLDYNNDGFLDIYITGGGDSDALYQNDGFGNYIDVSSMSTVLRITKNNQTSAAISGDINNDGCPDLFVTTADDSQNILLVNNCDGSFLSQGMDLGLIERSVSMGASFLDVNEDGLLDIYVINYIGESIFDRNENDDIVGFQHDCLDNYLYVNDGTGHYDEVANNYGVADIGCGLAVLSSDLNLDGYIDLYVVNDFGEWVEPNSAYINNYPDQSFSKSLIEQNLNAEIYGMGVSTGDIDQNGIADLYLSNIGSNVLLQSVDTMMFIDETVNAGVENDVNVDEFNVTSWGSLFFDFDHDLDLDLFVSNGFIGTAPFLKTTTSDPNKLFENDGEGVFTEIGAEYGVNSTFINRGAIYGDYDNDGDLDVFCVSTDGDNNSEMHSLLYRNELESENHWIQVLLEGVNGNRDAYGAKVIVYADGRAIGRELYGSGSYASQHSKVMHFGLAEYDAIDSIEVKWNANRQSVYLSPPVDETIYIIESNSSIFVLGCMDQNNDHYNENATYNTGCATELIVGCTDSYANNYNSEALIDDSSCTYDNLTLTIGAEQVLEKPLIYPSPFHNKLNVMSTEHGAFFDIFILDATGKVVKKILHNKNEIVEIDTSGLVKGLYFVRCKHMNGSESITKVFKD